MTAHGPGDPRAGQTTTPLVAFRAATPFRFHQAGTDPETEQEGRPGEVCHTSLAQFTRNVLARHPRQFRLDAGTTALPCLPRAAWAGFDFTGKRVLFLLPSQALGSNVCTLLFIAALRERFAMRGVGVFCAGSAADIWRTDPSIEVFALWLGARDLRRFDVVVDLGHLESRRDIEIWPVDMEGELLAAFGDLPPASAYPAAPRRLPADRPPRIGILPLASSPLRTLPAAVTQAVTEALAPRGAVTLCLNANQHQGRLYRSALAVPDGVAVVDAYPSIGGLLRALAAFDFVVAADSGPAHMAKLFATPGIAVYTSAPPEVLQGRFRNLVPWTVPFVGPHCAAPCGLAKLRITAEGRIGCMGSLGVGLDRLPRVAQAADPAVVERLLLREPVPCVALLATLGPEVARRAVETLAATRAG
ncbi:MAG: lipopolysaccharide heptosyltransferase family protein [Alphaproteobacteria bacterium]|nr:lipopolysaccharide heptosyltransferase family protein [Alphaproteobacteria bacterium]